MKLLWLLLSSSLSLAQVGVHPSNTSVTSLGGNSVFTCNLNTVRMNEAIVSIQWLLNDSAALLNESGKAMVEFSSIGNGIGALTFTDLTLEFNLTRVKCNASLQSGRIAISDHVTLLLQGTLSAVGSLHATSTNSIISLQWGAPFTLDIIDDDPDITYCIDIADPFMQPLHSQCGVNTTQFDYTLPPGSITGCYNYFITVTPVNTPGNGTQSTITYSQTLTAPQLMEVQSTLSSSSDFDNVTDIVIFHFIMSTFVCDAEINVLDENTADTVDSLITLSGSDLNFQSTIITFTSERLRLHTHYRATVNASNVNGSYTTNIKISTHSILRTEIQQDPLKMETEYLLNSTAAGGLFIFLFIDDNVITDFTKSVYLCLQKSDSQSYLLPFSQSPEFYAISAYDLEKDGLLVAGETYPATTFTDIIPGPDIPNEPSSSGIKDCNVSSNHSIVSCQCTYPPNAVSSGFLMVVQRDSISKARTLLVNSTLSERPLEPVTVTILEDGVYQVTIFAIREGIGIVGADVEYSTQITMNQEQGKQNMNEAIIGVGVGLGVLGMIVAILVGVVLAVQCRRMKTPLGKEETTSEEVSGVQICKVEEPGPALVYEEIGDVKKSFSYSQNVVYGLPLSSMNTASCIQSTSQLPPALPSPMTSSERPPALPTPMKSELTSEVPPSLNFKTTTTSTAHNQMNSDLTTPPGAGAEGGVSGSHDQGQQSHEYDLIKAANFEYSEVDAYKIQQCSAYGVPSSSASSKVM